MTESNRDSKTISIAGAREHQWVAFVTAVIAVFFLFHLRGNMTQVGSFGHSVFLWMVSRWKDTVSYGGVDYSHGWLLPFVSGWLIWRKRVELAAIEKHIDYRALYILTCATLVHFAGLRVAQTRLSLFALIMILWGLPFYFFGWKTAKYLIFPCGYLVFCIPLNFLHVVTFPLRLIATRMSVFALNGIGVSSARNGTRIILGAGQNYVFDVADPCSGLRSLLAIAAITAAYGYISQEKNWKRSLLFISCIPLAMFGNIVRIVTIGIVAVGFGEDFAMHLYHDYSGYFVFVVVVLIMVLFGKLLNRISVPGTKEERVT